MPKVFNEALAGKKIVTSEGAAEFDAAGVADATAEVAAVLAQLEGYTVEAAEVAEKKPAKKSSEKKSSEKE